MSPSFRSAAPRIVLVLVLVTLLWLMDWVYVHALVERFGEVGYPGFPNATHGPALGVMAWSLALVPALWMPITITRPSQVLYWCVYLMVFIPTAIVGVHATMPPGQILMMIVGSLAGLGVLQASYYLPLLRLPNVRLGPVLFWLILGGLSIASYTLALQTFGSTLRLVTLAEVYSQRAAWVDVGASPLVLYLSAWQSIVINPFLMAYGIVRHRWLLFALGLAGQVFFFAVAAQRYVLATTCILVGLHLIVRRSGTGYGLKVSAACAGAFAVPLMIRGDDLELVTQLVDLFLYRLFLNSGFLSALYFDYFSTNPHALFAGVKPLNLLITSPYPENYKETLAWDVWNMKNDPNANLFADGFAQLGYGGLVIEAMGLAIAFWLLDSVCRQRRYALGFAVLAVGGQVASVTNGQIPNLLLGGGFGVIIALLFLAPRSLGVSELPTGEA